MISCRLIGRVTVRKPFPQLIAEVQLYLITLYNVLPIKEYFESDGALMDAFIKSPIQSNNLRKRKNNHTRETPRILPSKVRCSGAKACYT